MENRFKSILVPYDESKYSNTALEYAVTLKKVYRSKITVLQVISSGLRYELTGEEKNKSTLQFDNKMGVEQIETFQNLKNQLKNFKTQFDIKIVVASNSVSAEIIDFSEKNNIDLIVMGSRGRTGIKKMLLGSVASEVITYAHCPVLVIK